VIFVYSQKDGTLDLNFRGARKAMEPLQGMFATTILNLNELPPDSKDERIYDLGLLGKRGFDFVYGVGSGIEDVAVRKLRLSSRFNMSCPWLWSARGDSLWRWHFRLSALLPVGLPRPAGNLG
jgi:hypothetical protein